LIETTTAQDVERTTFFSRAVAAEQVQTHIT
jgi:hypothetical protein